MKKTQGLVAVLDALGAADYSNEQIDQFLQSRRTVLDQLEQNAELKIWNQHLVPGQLTTFTFNDTVLIVLDTMGNPPSFDDVKHFCTLLRRFEVDSLIHGILFRGAVSLGEFRIDEDTNTVMGKAVSDAAAWYDKADWIGVNATPYASMAVQSLIEQQGDHLDHLLLDWDVHMKDSTTRRLKALNWPKVFVVKNMTPCVHGEHPRAKCASLLTVHGVPRGTELKYANTMDFYDHCIAERNKVVAALDNQPAKIVRQGDRLVVVPVKNAQSTQPDKPSA